MLKKSYLIIMKNVGSHLKQLFCLVTWCFLNDIKIKELYLVHNIYLKILKIRICKIYSLLKKILGVSMLGSLGESLCIVYIIIYYNL